MEYYPERILERYSLDSLDLDDLESSFDKIAMKRGALGKGGVPDYDKVYTLILRDFKDGMFGPVTLDRLEKEEV